MRISLSLPLLDSVATLRDRLNSSFAILADKLGTVPETARISGTSTSTYTAVNHTLGRVPTFVHVEPKAQCRWWVTDADRANWTATTVYLRFDTASVNFTGYVSVLE